MKYYWSDQHLDHYNIIKHSNRPFTNVNEMNRTMIENCKSIVQPNDELYFGGDICMNLTPEILSMIKSINCKKYLVKGNHDKKSLKNKNFRDLFVDIRDIMTIHDNDKTIVLCHYPMIEWDGYFRGTYHFYGHVHNNHDNQANKIMSNIDNAYNIGVDILGFMPRTADEIIKK